MSTQPLGPSSKTPFSVAQAFETSPRVARAVMQSWVGQVVGEVVDQSIEKSRRLREESALDQAKRDAAEQRAIAREAQDMRRRAEQEAADAKRLADLHRSNRPRPVE